MSHSLSRIFLMPVHGVCVHFTSLSLFVSHFTHSLQRGGFDGAIFAAILLEKLLLYALHIVCVIQGLNAAEASGSHHHDWGVRFVSWKREGIKIKVFVDKFSFL